MDRRTKILVIGIITVITIVALMLLVTVISVSAAVGNRGVVEPFQSTKFDIIIETTKQQEVFSEGYINLKLSLPRGIKLAGNVRVYIDSVQKYSFKVFPTNLQIPTFGLENGEHNVSVEAMSIDNNTGYGVVVFQVYDPTLSLISINYPSVIYPGMQFEISMEISGNPAYFTADFSTIFGDTEIYNSTPKDGTVLTGKEAIPINLVTAEMFYTIPIVVYSTTHRVLMLPGVKVFFQLRPTNPFTIEEGIISMRSFPSNEPTNSTLNVRIDENFEVSITTGQSIQIPLQLSQASTGSDILVGFEGFGQHFIIPIASLQNPTPNSRRASEKTGSEHEIFFVLKLESGSMVSGSIISMLIRIRDMAGGYGEIERITTVTSVSYSGTFHVRLTWNREADLDLHVVDPHNDEIYYGQRASTEQVGFLDLDSNGNCTIDHRKMENIYFELADSGEYIIRVDLYSACSVTTSITYEVWVEGCDMSQSLSGSFSPSQADLGGLGSGKEVIRFNTNCMEHLVSGTVSYQTPDSRANPLGSIVRVVDSSGAIYGTSQVELDISSSIRGIYSVPYHLDNINTHLYVEFLSSNNKIEVTDHEGQTHAYRSGFRPSTSRKEVVNAYILLSYSSGAYNIMITLTRMLPLYLAYGGKTSDYPRKANWEYRKYAKGTDFAISYFEDGMISIGGNEMDPDEWDESVMLHEFGHLILDRTGAVITGGGSHDGSPISPNFAFSEGYPTYLGQKIIGSLIYCDGWCQDLSDLEILTLGTTAYDDGSYGYISELVVASAAYRMDFEVELGNMMTNSLTDSSKLLKESNYDKLGTTSAVDFSDMVRMVVCPLGVTKKNKANKLLNEYNLPWLSEENFCY